MLAGVCKYRSLTWVVMGMPAKMQWRKSMGTEARGVWMDCVGRCVVVRGPDPIVLKSERE